MSAVAKKCNDETEIQNSDVQAEVVRACKSRFDEQLSRMYTRTVYNEYKREYANSTSFVIEPDPDVECGYLVKHEKGTGVFCWAQHTFKVLADKKEGIYKCECKQWEHTGLFCMHVIKPFTHLQVQSIPEKYILRRYTRNARSVVPWDRHNVQVATHADTANENVEAAAQVNAPG
jgi:hypothetical protein